MNRSDWNHMILNEIHPELVEEAAVPFRKRSFRPVRIAVAAACMCALLLGGAFAAEAIFGIPIFKSVGTNPLSGDPINGFQAIVEQPETTTTNPITTGVFKLPDTAFSEKAHTLAAEKGHGWVDLRLDSWQEAESLLGIDLISNPVLNNAVIGSVYYAESETAPPEEYVCRLTLGAINGKLASSSAESVYFLNYVDQYEGGVRVSSTPVRMALTVNTYTENSMIAPEDIFTTYGFPENYTFTSEHYTASNGVTALLVGVSCPDSDPTSYYAFFAWKGSAVTLKADYAPDPTHALSTLKEVLDAFQ